MAFEDLPSHYQNVVRQCMSAVVDGPFLEDFEFHARLGLSRETFRAVLARWPKLDDSKHSSDDFLAVNNSLNEVCYGINISEEEWSEWFTVPRKEIELIYKDWSGRIGRKSSGLQ